MTHLSLLKKLKFVHTHLPNAYIVYINDVHTEGKGLKNCLLLQMNSTDLGWVKSKLFLDKLWVKCR